LSSDIPSFWLVMLEHPYTTHLYGISEPCTFSEITDKKTIKYSFLVFLKRIKCSMLLFYYECRIVLKACLLILTSLPPHNTTSYQ
jgi:hypothetical protein